MIRRPRRSTARRPSSPRCCSPSARLLGSPSSRSSCSGRPRSWVSDQLLAVTSGQRWNAPAPSRSAIVLAVLGLVLLVAGLRPGKPTVVPLPRMVPDGRPAPTRACAARPWPRTSPPGGHVAGVTPRDVSARRGRITATVRVAAADPAAVPEQVRERLEARVAAIARLPPKVRSGPVRTHA